MQCVSAIKLAVVCCTDHGFQKDMICDLILTYCQSPHSACEYKKMDRMILKSKLKNVPEMLSHRYELPEFLRKEVVSSMETITRNILQWCLYRCGKLHLPLDYVVHFLNESLFNSEGDILEAEAAKKIVSDESLGVGHRFTVACGYTMTDLIGDLWQQLSTEEKNQFFISENQESLLNNSSGYQYDKRIRQSHLPRLWAYYLSGRLQELPFWKGTRGQSMEKAVWRHAVEQTVVDCNSTAIRFVWEQPSIRGKERVAKAIALTITKKLLYRKNNPSFKNKKFVDIMCFLMSNMSEEVKKDFLKEDLRKFQYSKVLFNLLRCDKGDVFLKTIALMWDFLPLKEYDHILRQRNISRNNGKLFNEVWSVSPAHFRKYALKEGDFIYSRLTRNCSRTIKNILDVLSAEERFSVLFSKFEGRHYESGLFVIAFAAGYLNLARSLAKACELNERDKKQLMKKELNYFVNELNFETVTKRQLVFWEYRCCNRRKMDWMEKRHEAVLRLLQTTKGLRQYNNFFLWCFTSQEDITDFKKKMFLRISSSNIFYEITFCNVHSCNVLNFDGRRKSFARKFLQYFDVKGSQLKSLYKRTIMNFMKSYAMRCLIPDVPRRPEIDRYEFRFKKVMTVIKWCLIDKEFVSEIRHIVRNELDQMKDRQGVDTVRKDFELAFEQRLKELDGA